MAPTEYYPDGLPVDGVFDVLSHRTRRILIDVFRETETTTLGTVAAELVEADGSQSHGSESDAETELVEAELHHVHLPKMAEVGLIDYDPDVETISINHTVDTACDILDTAVRGDDG